MKANLAENPKHRLTAEEVQAQLMTFVFAGWSTVLSVLSQLLRQVALHQDVQDRLRSELRSIGAHPPADQLVKLEYLEAVLRESVRLADFVPLERVATQDDIIPLAQPVQLLDGSFINCIPVRKGQAIQ